MRNVEIKAFVKDPKGFLSKVESIAKKTDAFQQVDYFFNVPKERGRLKLRIQSPSAGSGATESNPMVPEKGQLIFYNRNDQSGPKLSNYIIYETKEPMVLISTMDMAIGVTGKVQKHRTLYMYGQTRIHYDQVNDLGRFMELEVVLKEDQTAEQGQEIAKAIMEQLGVQQSDLVEGAYFDLLSKVKDQKNIV